MKVKYFEETDTLYIELESGAIVESRDLDENTVLDLDAGGNICAITMEHAKDRAAYRAPRSGGSPPDGKRAVESRCCSPPLRDPLRLPDGCRRRMEAALESFPIRSVGSLGSRVAGSESLRLEGRRGGFDLSDHRLEPAVGAALRALAAGSFPSVALPLRAAEEALRRSRARGSGPTRSRSLHRHLGVGQPDVLGQLHRQHSRSLVDATGGLLQILAVADLEPSVVVLELEPHAQHVRSPRVATRRVATRRRGPRAVTDPFRRSIDWLGRAGSGRVAFRTRIESTSSAR